MPDGVKSEWNFKAPTTEDELEKACIARCESFNKAKGDLNETDGYDCPICKNKGFIAKPEKTEFGYWTEMNYRCKCQKTRSAILRLNKSGLKNVIRDYTFDRYECTEAWQTSIKDAAMRFTKDDENTWFFIGGATGAGKTHICTAICRQYLLDGKNVKYMLWRDDVVRLKSSVTDSMEYEKLMNELKTADVLYIDDLFKTGKDGEGKAQRPTAADINIAFELLNYRYNNPALITIVSSECRIKDILDIDEAIGGRISEKARNYTINLKPGREKNYRIKMSEGLEL